MNEDAAKFCTCSYGLAGGWRVHDCDCPVHGPMPQATPDGTARFSVVLSERARERGITASIWHTEAGWQVNTYRRSGLSGVSVTCGLADSEPAARDLAVKIADLVAERTAPRYVKGAAHSWQRTTAPPPPPPAPPGIGLGETGNPSR